MQPVAARLSENLDPPYSGNRIFVRLQQAIDRQDFKEAIEEILFLPVNTMTMADLKQLYVYLLDLLTCLEDTSQFEHLKCHLPAFLALTPSFTAQQGQLALCLADRCVKANTYLAAIDYFGKALQIGKVSQNEELIQKADEGASRLFMRIIDFHRGHFKNRLELARGHGNVREVEDILAQIEHLKRFCCEQKDKKVIRSFYDDARSVWSHIPADKKHSYSASFNDLFAKRERFDNQPLDIALPLITKAYQERLNTFRKRFTTFLALKTYDTETVRRFQTQCSLAFYELLQTFLKDAFTVLGPPRCPYDFRVLGSAGRREIVRFSDLEILLLYEPKTDFNRKYFADLIWLLDFQIRSLGETASENLTFVFKGSPQSLHLDLGGTLLDHVKTPQELAQLQCIFHAHVEDPSAADPNTLAHTSLKSASLNTNDESLFTKYLEEKDKASPQHFKELALKYLKARLLAYEKAWPPKTFSNPVHLKTHYTELLNLLIADISLFFNVKETNTLDIIDVLVEKQVFTRESGELLKQSVATLYTLRLRLHEHYDKPKEEGFLSGLEGYVFNKSERDQLDRIYWIVLEPLYACLKAVLTKDKQTEGQVQEFTHNFQRFDLLQTALQRGLENSAQHTIRHLAAYLVEIDVSYTQHLKNVKELSQKIEFEPLRQIYFEVLEKNLPAEKRDQIDLLAVVPNRAGLRYALFRGQQRLQTTLCSLTTFKPEKAGNITSVKVLGSNFGAYLKPEIIHKILEPDGNIRNFYPGSAHRVAPAEGLHFKQKPTQALMEYANHTLASRVAGDLTPPSQLVRFEVEVNGEKKIYPVLISETIEGTDLRKIPEQNLRLSPENWTRWTWMLLCAILTRPGDGRRANYNLKNGYISCVDNDISFVEPAVKFLLSLQIYFCSALFCFFSEEALDQQALLEFTLLDVDAILNGWIEDLIEKEQAYLSLFSEEEQKKLYDEEENNRFKATILFREGTLATLNLQFCRLQNYILDQLQQKKPITPHDLLKQLISLRENPTVVNSAGVYVHDAYKKANKLPLSVEEKLKVITDRKGDRSLLSSQSDQACLGEVPTFDQVNKLKLYTPAKAREELFMTLLNRRSNAISVGTIQGKKVIQASFKDIIKDKAPDLERQKLVLQALRHVIAMEEPKPNSITLQYCAVLDSNTLTPFLPEPLEYLDLSFCPQIKDKDVETIQQKCPFLNTLRLSGCSQLRNLAASSGVFSTSPLDFVHEELKKFKGHTKSIRGFTLLENGKKLASESNDATTCIWDVEAGLLMKKFETYGGQISDFLVMEGGKYLDQVDIDTFRIWGGETEKDVKKHQWIRFTASSVAVLEEGKKLIVGEQDGTIHILNLGPGLEHLYIDQCENLQTLRLKANLKILSANKNPQLKNVDLQTHVFPHVEFNQCEKLDIPSAWTSILNSLDGPVFPVLLQPSLWVTLSQVVKANKSLQDKFFSFIEQSRTDPQKAITAANAISILNLAGISFAKRDFRGIRIPCAYLVGADLEGANLRDADLTGVDLSEANLRGANLDRAQMEWVELGQWPFITSEKGVSGLITFPRWKNWIGTYCDDTIWIWDVETQKEIRKLIGHTDKITSHIILEGGKKLVTGSWDGSICIWDVETGKLLKIIYGPQASFLCLAVFDEGKKLVSGSDDRSVRIWDVETGKQLQNLLGHTASVVSLAILKGGKKLASGGADKMTYIWDLETGQKLNQLEGHEDTVVSLVTLKDEKRLVSTSGTYSIHMWDIDTCQEIERLESASTVYSPIILEGEKLLISGSHDNDVHICDLKTGHEREILHGHTAWIKSLAILDGGKKLISACENDNTIRIWKLENRKFLRIHSSKLACDGVRIGTIKGLSQANRDLMLQHGAI